MEHVVHVIWADGCEDIFPASDIIDAEEIRDRMELAGGNQIEWCGIASVTYEAWLNAHSRR